MKNIIRDMVEKGYELGYIYLINNPNDGEIAAQIGDNWFYFDSTEDRLMSVEEYEANVLSVDIVELIHMTLTDMKTEFEDEYLYYFAYLFENLKDNMILTWDDLNEEFPEDRYHMTEDRERTFVYYCFNLYEMEGFNDVYWTPYDEEENFIGQKFKSIRRCPESRNSLEMQPLWDVEFENGKQYTVYPEEIIPSEMKAHGCPDEYLKNN